MRTGVAQLVPTDAQDRETTVRNGSGPVSAAAIAEAAAEASADYDGGAAEGKDKLDEALKFRVGYTW